MASDLIVPVVEVKNVRIHPNADMLSICEVLGYQMVNGLVEDPEGEIVRKFIKGERDARGKRVPVTNPNLKFETEAVRFSFRYKDGDKAIYFPADTILSDTLAEEFEVKHLLQSGNRVGRAKLRGEPSFGLIVALPDGVDWEIGQNVADHYDVQKWRPDPDQATAPDAAPYDSDIDPFFVKYTDVQDGLMLYKHFQPDEEVVATEKIHGRNCRVGYVNGTLCVGSRTVRLDPEVGRDKSMFWPVAERPEVKKLLDAVLDCGVKTVILFGEVYGPGVQSLHYGCTKEKGFRAFDVYVDGSFYDFHSFADLCDLHGVERTPVLFQGPFDLEKVKEVAEGKSVLPGASNIREGVVVRTAVERRDPAWGRMVMKFISSEYDLSKHKKKDTTDV